MCLGVPQRLTRIEGIAGHCEGGALVDLSLLPEAQSGDWVLNFLGTAREILSPEAAGQIRAALAGLAALMAGGPVGDAFADLEARSPQLPPHLQAAQDAGLASG